MTSSIIKKIWNQISLVKIISISDQGNSGYIHYHDGPVKFELYYEFNGVEKLTKIWIPTPEQWTDITGLPVSMRNKVLRKIAEEVCKDRVSISKLHYTLEENYIHIFS